MTGKYKPHKLGGEEIAGVDQVMKGGLAHIPPPVLPSDDVGGEPRRECNGNLLPKQLLFPPCHCLLRCLHPVHGCTPSLAHPCFVHMPPCPCQVTLVGIKQGRDNYGSLNPPEPSPIVSCTALTLLMVALVSALPCSHAAFTVPI